MALFIIDFDRTIVDGHTHNTILTAIRSRGVTADDKEAQWGLIKTMHALGGSDKWKAVFTSMLENGHHVAIASFNSYPHVIPRFLREVIGLTEDQVSRIHVNAWLPADPVSADKNEHIEQIISHFYPAGDRPRRDQVVLVDDSDNNIIAAEVADFRAVQAEKDLMFFGQVEALIAELKVDASQAASPAPKR